MESNDIYSLLQQSLAALQKVDFTMEKAPPVAVTTDLTGFKVTSDFKKEYATSYEVRLSTLKPIVMATAQKKWKSENLLYHNSLINVRPGVLINFY